MYDTASMIEKKKYEPESIAFIRTPNKLGNGIKN
jgi:hypothetical protein